MPDTVVVALDQSKLSETAIPFAIALARQYGARLKILSVLSIPAMQSEWLDDYLEDDPWHSEYLKMVEYLEGVAANIDGVTVGIEVRVGLDAAIEINTSMSEERDALLVVTTKGRSGLKRLVLGSITSRLMHIATYPLMVVPAEAEESPESISRILVPLDGSSFSEYALDVTLRLFDESPPALHLLQVIDAILGDNEADTAIRNELRAAATAFLSRIADDLTGRGYQVDWEIDEALDVPNRIAAGARLTDSQVIALATHGRTGFSRFFLGSVADELTRDSTRPVILVRPSEDVVSRAPESRTRISRRARST